MNPKELNALLAKADEKEEKFFLQHNSYRAYLEKGITPQKRMEIIGANLADMRKAANITQKELCSLLKIAPQTYSGYESGKHEPPIETLIRIAYLYNLPLDYIVGIKTFEDIEDVEEGVSYAEPPITAEQQEWELMEQSNLFRLEGKVDKLSEVVNELIRKGKQ